MEKEDIFKFGDFVNGDKFSDLRKMKSELVKEGLFSDGEDDTTILDNEDEEINQEFNPYKTDVDEAPYNNNFDTDVDDIDDHGTPYVDNIDEFENLEDSVDYYKLFKDKAEDFICDIAVEGVNNNNTEVRLIVESEDWNLMFTGEIKNGKCIIPIKKLNILNEGQTGNIKLEVNADGNLFTPWEDKFIVKVSKKVTVNLNESKEAKKENKKGVKVNVRK
jgi:hypothetical protein